MKSDNAAPSETTPTTIEAGESKATTSWRPRIHGTLSVNTNPFEDFDISGGSVLDGAALNRSIEIKDPTKDTAPLQGSKDVSDEDYLGTDAG
jgi:hypothetical protein